MERLYFDANAGSTLRPAAVAAITELVRVDGEFRNPSSVHSSGRNARALLSSARAAILKFVGAPSDSTLVFTSGGTESCNLMLFGYLPLAAAAGATVVASAIEHPAVSEPLRALEIAGARVIYVNPERDGRVSAEKFIAAVDDSTLLVTLMAAHNETGALQPVAEVARRLRSSGYRGVMVSDAVQYLGKTSEKVGALLEAGVDAVSLGGHKAGAPSGIGALVMRRAKEICRSFSPVICGGAQESRLRGGTENLFGAAAFGEVSRYLEGECLAEVSRVTMLREQLWTEVRAAVPGAERLTPELGGSISNTLLVRIPECRGDDLVVASDLKGLSVSAGAACSSGKPEPSPSVLAMGRPAQEARQIVRFSLDWNTTSAAVTRAAGIFAEAVQQMRTQGGGDQRGALA